MPKSSGHSRLPQTPAPAGDTRGAPSGNGHKTEAKILFQKYFKSIGPRTYAAQLKEAGNGNHFLVLTEGKRDPETGEVKKIRVFVYSEDFPQYFRMLHETAQFIKAHPVPEDVKIKRQRYWAKKEAETAAAAREASAAHAAIRPPKVAPPKTTQRRPARGR